MARWPTKPTVNETIDRLDTWAPETREPTASHGTSSIGWISSRPLKAGNIVAGVGRTSGSTGVSVVGIGGATAIETGASVTAIGERFESGDVTSVPEKRGPAHAPVVRQSDA